MIHTQDGAAPLEDVLEAEATEIESIRASRNALAKIFDELRMAQEKTTGHPITPDERVQLMRDAATQFRPFDKGRVRPAAKGPAPRVSPPSWQERDKDKWVGVIDHAHADNFVGLALSGGGIRSATFNLGVLQALAELKLLQRIDYLSTVSGGGYIGGWLAAWTWRLRDSGGFREVQHRLATNRVNQEEDNEPPPIRFLRMFSNYLTPKLGLFSGDTWTMVGIYLRNTLLNQVTVLALVAAVLLMPHLAVRIGMWTCADDGRSAGAVVLAVVLVLVALLIIPRDVQYRLDQRPTRQRTTSGRVLALAGVPLFVAAVLGALALAVNGAPARPGGAAVVMPYAPGPVAGAATYLGIWLVATTCAWTWENWLRSVLTRMRGRVATVLGFSRWTEPATPSLAQSPWLTVTAPKLPRSLTDRVMTYLVAPAGAGALAGALCALFARYMPRGDARLLLTVGPPSLLGIFLLAGTLQIGLMGAAFHDWRREWWGRLGGWLLLWGVAWTALFWVALYLPSFITHDPTLGQWRKEIAAKYLTPTWILSTAGGLLAGKGRGTGTPGTLTWKDVAAKASPYVFMTGLFCWVSWVISNAPLSLLETDSAACLCWAILACVAVAALMAWRVDINQFSMHLFYRNRLVACFLGASHAERSPNRFTGLDPHDDIALKQLTNLWRYDGPYPVLNASLNLVKGQDLAWQERKAESFVMTPRYCGYDVWLEEQDSPMMRKDRSLPGHDGAWMRKLDRFGYRPTKDYAFPSPLDGPRLGLAMGLSGAAASPNMGFYSSTPVAFLMTVFNVRLGQWLGNPRHRETWRRSAPRSGLTWLLRELTAGTNDEAAYVYLSDGGHFENLGVYELVKRRCGLIIVCDAEEDGGYAYAGLANAIGKCRIDLGIDIELDVKAITPKKNGGPSTRHCAFGKIHYETVDMNAPVGTIVYFKASLTGDEPTDIGRYKSRDAAFPHDSTINQWFSESQFESYRMLGYHEVMSSFQAESRSTRVGPHLSLSQWLTTAITAGATKPQSTADELFRVCDTFGFDTSRLVDGGTE